MQKERKAEKTIKLFQGSNMDFLFKFPWSVVEGGKRDLGTLKNFRDKHFFIQSMVSEHWHLLGDIWNIGYQCPTPNFTYMIRFCHFIRFLEDSYPC